MPVCLMYNVYMMRKGQGDTMTATEMYRDVMTKTRNTARAVEAVIDMGLTVDQAVELSWTIETGGPEPTWLHEDGTQTQAAREWDAGHERASDGE